MAISKRVAALAAGALLALAGCGGGGNGDPSTATPGTSAAAPTTSASAEEYVPVSDVTAHAALGQDVAKIKDLLGAAKEDQPVDWTAVGAVFEEGGASTKGDGSIRTLATLLDSPETIASIRAAIAGTGDSAGASDKVRHSRSTKASRCCWPTR